MPFEIGMGILLIWTGLTLRDASIVATRYPKSYWIWSWLEATGADGLAPWFCAMAAGMTVIGLFLEYIAGWKAWRLKAAGFGMATLVFGLVAVGHLTQNTLSVAGPPYLFVAWRCLVLASLYWERGRQNALAES